MDKLITSGNMTMSSLEIADMVEKRHDNVKRTIENLANQGVIEFPQIEEIPTATRPTGVYVFAGERGKRDSIIVVAQLSPEFTARLVDRWHELESAAAKPAPVELTRMELIQLAMAAEQEKLELVAKLEEQAPKVQIADRISEATNTLCIRDAAKTLQVQPSKLTQWLVVNKWIYHRPGKSGYLAYQDKIQSCYLIHKTTAYRDSHTGDEKISEQVRITGRGLTLIAQKLNENGLGLLPTKVPKIRASKGVH